MSLFTRKRKIRNQEKQECIECLEEGNKQIEKSMDKMLSIAKLIEKEHPEFEELEREEKVKILIDYYGKI